MTKRNYIQFFLFSLLLHGAAYGADPAPSPTPPEEPISSSHSPRKKKEKPKKWASFFRERGIDSGPTLYSALVALTRSWFIDAPRQASKACCIEVADPVFSPVRRHFYIPASQRGLLIDGYVRKDGGRCQLLFIDDLKKVIVAYLPFDQIEIALANRPELRTIFNTHQEKQLFLRMMRGNDVPLAVRSGLLIQGGIHCELCNDVIHSCAYGRENPQLTEIVWGATDAGPDDPLEAPRKHLCNACMYADMRSLKFEQPKKVKEILACSNQRHTGDLAVCSKCFKPFSRREERRLGFSTCFMCHQEQVSKAFVRHTLATLVGQKSVHLFPAYVRDNVVRNIALIHLSAAVDLPYMPPQPISPFYAQGALPTDWKAHFKRLVNRLLPKEHEALAPLMAACKPSGTFRFAFYLECFRQNRYVLLKRVGTTLYYCKPEGSRTAYLVQERWQMDRRSLGSAGEPDLLNELT